MKKLLVCGSTGFLGANFIRYLLYRSKDYEIISIDNLNYKGAKKKVYFNNKHKFYIGDASNKEFLNKLIDFENPDFIICSEEIIEYEKILRTSINISEVHTPSITILPATPSNDKDQICAVTKNILMKNGKYVVEVPNKFGMRQSPNNGTGSNLSTLIKQFLYTKQVLVTSERIPWVYAEDVASFIWYLIETTPEENFIRMPVLGWMSEKDIALRLNRMYQQEFEIHDNVTQNYFDTVVTEFESSEFGDWKADSQDLVSALEKTIKWFDVNRWALE